MTCGTGTSMQDNLGAGGTERHSGAADLLRSANWVAGEFRDVGFPMAEVLRQL
ncbi:MULTISPECIES: hypothetical protein [unclassified Arthrobacter]|uniref:hypothetical protein n=1 Tax=unclassified Arthrobacter TaxID=235627 RepID=UPI001F365346|nr:hypothetical protein [Arthrobacter sp. FW306-06-A]UKA70365.1 hypothetical protein LFT49_16725 [Arthrobacter sp. FW306-06-A]